MMMYTEEQRNHLNNIGHEAEKFKDIWESASDNGNDGLRKVAYKIYESYCGQYEKMSEYYYNMNR